MGTPNPMHFTLVHITPMHMRSLLAPLMQSWLLEMILLPRDAQCHPAVTLLCELVLGALRGKYVGNRETSRFEWEEERG